MGQQNNFQTVNNFFSSSIATGTFYTTGFFELRQQYDIIGLKDSVVTDTVVTPLFYPKFRAEQTINYSTYHERFLDYFPQPAYYINNLKFISTPDTINLSDLWHNLTNDFSLYSFPDSKNPQQFLKAGITVQSMKGFYNAGQVSYYNLFVHGEYRNKNKGIKNGMWRPLGIFILMVPKRATIMCMRASSGRSVKTWDFYSSDLKT